MKKYSIGIMAFALLLGSCKKQLDQQSPDVVSEANAFQTLEHVQFGLNAAYARYSTYSTDMYKSALVSDEAKLGVDNSGQGALEFRYQYSSDETTGGDVTAGYFGYYNMIDQINRVLPEVYKVEGPASAAPRRDIINAQLLALRGIAHFALLKNFSANYDPADKLGIAVMTVSDAAAKPARNTVAESIQQIETDLSTAKAALPDVTPATFKDTVMNKINIAAYQARIALYKRDYAAAITFATEVINSNVKPLASGGDFKGIWTDENDSETLFRIRYGTSSGIGSMWTTTGGLAYVAPSDKLIASYADEDIRKEAFIGSTGDKDYVNKFYQSSRGGRVVDMKAARISEMYLIRAEAYAKKESPDVASGAADLNELRTARIENYTDETFSSAGDLVDAVLEERFKELCFEGFRIFDLKRNNLPVERSATDAEPGWSTLPADSYRFTFPIPKAEMNVNPKMVQNPGY